MDNSRFRNYNNNTNNNNNNSDGRGNYQNYRRSRSRSRDRGYDQYNNYNGNRRNSRSRSRERSGYNQNDNCNKDNDLYRDIINQDFRDGNNGRNQSGGYNSRGYNNKYRGGDNDNDGGGDGSGSNRYYNDRQRNRNDYYEHDNRDGRRNRERDGNRDNRRYGGSNNSYRRQNQNENDYNERNSEESDENSSNYDMKNQTQTPSNTIFVLGLQPDVTEADIMNVLSQADITPAAITLTRKRTTGASRGFAFVELYTTEQAVQWMEYTKGTIQLSDTCQATLQYSLLKDWNCGRCGTFNFKRRGTCFKCSASRDEGEPTGPMEPDDSKGKQRVLNASDWYCGQCGVFNFKRRESCFKCFASRNDSTQGGEGGEEISHILTKKIMLRNLDVLTNEESVLTAITQHASELADKINKVIVSRDALTQTSRGICYLSFDSLVDSMNMYNLLSTLEPPLVIDEREVAISYCVDHENRQIVNANRGYSSAAGGPNSTASNRSSDMASSSGAGQYTLNDVPRLAEYSASLYATTPAEHAHYVKYYTDYYIKEITDENFSNLPTIAQMSDAQHAGEARAPMAMQKKVFPNTATAAVVTPKGNDGKIYPTPDVSLYQYDETSGYYYDPSTGLYYDAHSQYYYNNETGAYLYWDQRKSSYVLATPSTVAATVQASVKPVAEAPPPPPAEDESASKKDKKEAGGNKHDKVKVAKKIAKEMERWAKQLNQKKDYVPLSPPQQSSSSGTLDDFPRPSNSATGPSGGYADVGFSILEKKAVNKLGTNLMPPITLAAPNKLLPAYGSDSEDEAAPPTSALKRPAMAEASEADYVDFTKLTCLLCKRAFQSLDILQKHLKMSKLHKENMAKLNVPQGGGEEEQSDTNQEASLAAALSYRDRAKERRKKYGESDTLPPPNPSRERFEKEIKSLTSRSSEAPVMPIGSNNVGNRLLQKMGWSEGQGLGRKNQGRTNIIEANTRNSTAGLGNKIPGGPPCDYKTYIRKMMKSRYESV